VTANDLAVLADLLNRRTNFHRLTTEPGRPQPSRFVFSCAARNFPAGRSDPRHAAALRAGIESPLITLTHPNRDGRIRGDWPLKKTRIVMRHHVSLQLRHEIHQTTTTISRDVPRSGTAHPATKPESQAAGTLPSRKERPHRVRRVSTLSMYSAVCCPGRMPGMNRAGFFRLSAVSRALKTSAV